MKNRKWACFDGIPTAIVPREKATTKPKPRASVAEKDLQAMAEDLCDALGVRWFRIPDKLLQWLKWGAPTWVRVFVSRYLAGVPDMMLFKPDQQSGDNVAVFIEIKTEIGKLTQSQRKWHRGLNVRVTRGWRETELAIRDFAK